MATIQRVVGVQKWQAQLNIKVIGVTLYWLWWNIKWILPCFSIIQHLSGSDRYIHIRACVYKHGNLLWYTYVNLYSNLHLNTSYYHQVYCLPKTYMVLLIPTLEIIPESASHFLPLYYAVEACEKWIFLTFVCKFIYQFIDLCRYE